MTKIEAVKFVLTNYNFFDEFANQGMYIIEEIVLNDKEDFTSDDIERLHIKFEDK
jgi:hypothetical protein